MSKAWWVWGAMIGAALVMAVGAFGEPGSSPTGLLVRENVLLRMMPDIYPDTIVVSADGKHFAYAAEREKSSAVVVDGQESGPYDFMWQGRISLSAEGGRVAYGATRRGQNFVVSNGIEGRPYERVGRVALSADGKHLAYTAVREGMMCLVVDGVEGEAWEDLGMPVYAPAGDRLVYTAKRGGQWYVVEGGKTGAGYDEIGRTRFFSPEGGHIAFPVRFGRKWAVVMDGVKGEEYDRVEAIVFSDDGQHMAYVAQDARQWKVVVDGVARVVGSRLRGAVFAPGSAKLGYIEPIDDKPVLVIDGVPGKVYAGLLSFELSRGGEHIALVVAGEDQSLSDTLATRGESTGTRSVILDGRESPRYDAIAQVRFSPDGEHLVYAARQGPWWKVFWDGEEVGRYEDILNRGQVVFNQAGEACFAARRGAEILWVEVEAQ